MTTPIAETVYALSDLLTQAAALSRRLAAQVNAQHERDRQAMTEATVGAGVAASQDFADVSRQLDAVRAEVAELRARLEQREQEHGG